MKRPSASVVIAVSFAMLIGIGTYSYLSPGLTIREIEAASRAKDTEELRDLIDFDSLKAGLKEDVRTIFAETRRSELNGNAFGVLGMALAGAMIDPMIESFVTPSSILRMISGHLPEKKRDDHRES